MKVKQLVVALTLAMVASLGVTAAVEAPAAAAPATSQHGVTVISRSAPPRWMGAGTPSMSVDWKWRSFGWEVRFNRNETNRMAFAFSGCTLVVGPFLPAPWAVVLYGACAVVALAAGWAAVNGKCLTAWVPGTLLNPQMYQRTC